MRSRILGAGGTINAERGVDPTGSSGVVEMGGGGMARLVAILRGCFFGAVIFLTGADSGLSCAGFRSGARTTCLDLVI